MNIASFKQCQMQARVDLCLIYTSAFLFYTQKYCLGQVQHAKNFQKF